LTRAKRGGKLANGGTSGIPPASRVASSDGDGAGGRAFAAGELDPAFGTGGKVTFEFLAATFAMNDVLVTSDGRS
jgi:hypothetical protein